MKWEDFYEHFYFWADSTAINRISQLTTFGPHEEVFEIVQMYSDEKDSSRLADKAMDAGVRFTPEEIVEMQGFVTRKCMNRMVTTALGDFTQEQVEDLVFAMDDDIYEELEKRYCNYDDEEEEEDIIDEAIEQPQRRKASGLLGFFALTGIASEFNWGNKISRFRIGDHVRVKYRGQEGTIIDVNGDLYMVSMSDGKHVDSYSESQLEKVW